MIWRHHVTLCINLYRAKSILELDNKVFDNPLIALVQYVRYDGNKDVFVRECLPEGMINWLNVSITIGTIV